MPPLSSAHGPVRGGGLLLIQGSTKLEPCILPSNTGAQEVQSSEGTQGFVLPLIPEAPVLRDPPLDHPTADEPSCLSTLAVRTEPVRRGAAGTARDPRASLHCRHKPIPVGKY